MPPLGGLHRPEILILATAKILVVSITFMFSLSSIAWVSEDFPQKVKYAACLLMAQSGHHSSFGECLF
jgi:hypothetical protein